MILSTRGKSSIVLSSQITLQEAIRAATSLKNHIKATISDTTPLLDITEGSASSEMSVLHSAVGILKSEIASLEENEDYPDSS